MATSEPAVTGPSRGGSNIEELSIHLLWDLENCPPPRPAELARQFVSAIYKSVYDEAVKQFEFLQRDHITYIAEAYYCADIISLVGRDFPKTCERQRLRLVPLFRKGAHWRMLAYRLLTRSFVMSQARKTWTKTS